MMKLQEKQRITAVNRQLQDLVIGLSEIVSNGINAGKQLKAEGELDHFKSRHAANIMKALVNAERGIVQFNAIIRMIDEEEFCKFANAGSRYLRSIRTLQKKQYQELANLDKILYNSLGLFQELITIAKAMLNFLIEIKSTIAVGHPAVDIVVSFAEAMIKSCDDYTADLNRLSVVVQDLAVVVEQLKIPCQELNRLVHNVRDDFNLAEQSELVQTTIPEVTPAKTVHEANYIIESGSNKVKEVS
jgi:hypothetical protein